MSNLFQQLLRSNFRCGRMLNSRALDLAGWCDELGLFVIVNTPGWQFWNDSHHSQYPA